jgi:predicted nucleic acid-binding protein
MSGRDFLDTNILVYALDITDLEKHRTARELVSKAVAGEFVISTQVIAELSAILLQKFRLQFSPIDVLAALEAVSPIPLIAPDGDIVRRAVEAHVAYGLHFYDGMIIAAAERAGSQKIWSEDLNPGQKYFGLEVVNPFRQGAFLERHDEACF